jgi:transposase InsO family protein
LRAADITAVWTLEGWLYLATVPDLYDRQFGALGEQR